MSGGSYNYLSSKVGDSELLESYEDVEAMLQRLQELEYASEVAKETESVLADFDTLKQLEAKIQAKSRNLASVWHAVEWWDSRDWSEDEVKKAVSEFQLNQSN